MFTHSGWRPAGCPCSNLNKTYPVFTKPGHNALRHYISAKINNQPDCPKNKRVIALLLFRAKRACLLTELFLIQSSLTLGRIFMGIKSRSSLITSQIVPNTKKIWPFVEISQKMLPKVDIPYPTQAQLIKQNSCNQIISKVYGHDVLFQIKVSRVINGHCLQYLGITCFT